MLDAEGGEVVLPSVQLGCAANGQTDRTEVDHGLSLRRRREQAEEDATGVFQRDRDDAVLAFFVEDGTEAEDGLVPCAASLDIGHRQADVVHAAEGRAPRGHAVLVSGVAGRLASDLMQPARLLYVEVVRVAEQTHVLQREASDWSEISCGVLVRHGDLPGYVALQHSGTTFP